MFYALFAFILSALPLVYAQDTNTTVVAQALGDAKIVPTVVPNFTVRLPLEVVFKDNSGQDFLVSAGANLTINQTANLPSFGLLSNNTAIIGKPYLMAIIDPDVPNPMKPSGGPFRHFLASDFISNGSVAGVFVLTNQSKTATLTDYVPPNPPADSPPHRYVVLCYLQNSTGVTPPSGFNASDRHNFNVTQFVDSVQGNNFTLISATYFWVSANDTTGSVKPTNVTGAPPAAPTATSPSKTGGAVHLGAALAWSVGAVFAATGALLL